MAYSHQDWNTVVVRKPQAVKKEIVNKSAVEKTKPTLSSVIQDKPAWKIEKMVDDGEKLKRVSKEDALAIIRARVAAKLSQEQLAQRVNMQPKDIKEIESCHAFENKAVLAKLKRVLGM
jgi:ribosome-binding protein aMBF1 (putative translation factor)